MRPSSFLSTAAILGFIPFSLANILNFVAHQDDDLLFLSPDLIRDILSGQSVRTVYLTAGDAGMGSSYWSSRQAGSQAAYARMAVASNNWIESDPGIEGKEISIYTLADNQAISLAFMRLPDGNLDGSGFAADDNESLQKLWEGTIDQISTIDGSGTTYTRDELTQTLSSLISDFGPDEVKTGDYANNFGEGDHSDHYATGYFVVEALQSSGSGANLVGYYGYPIQDWAVNLDASDIEDKTNIFYTYAAYDTATCSTADSCSSRPESAWLQREYQV
ncbi:F5/8 type C domain protein [Aspergillus ellipticus CBS 707.79]|uniref:N-acetylglucosaminylphosphatidylinositol deacetylase n=1 Tax=Aspergillus ellipticus CBS 707.79 TaxID=1448320 RepID=A0A319DIV6_9EURO|nr:F5/8 type C domain protein [Aspergillus ellipticus CBS 707.79]